MATRVPVLLSRAELSRGVGRGHSENERGDDTSCMRRCNSMSTTL